MNIVLVWLIAQSVALTFAIASFVLAYNDMGSWGWFMFAAIFSTAVSGKHDE